MPIQRNVCIVPRQWLMPVRKLNYAVAISENAEIIQQCHLRLVCNIQNTPITPSNYPMYLGYFKVSFILTKQNWIIMISNKACYNVQVLYSFLHGQKSIIGRQGFIFVPQKAFYAFLLLRNSHQNCWSLSDTYIIWAEIPSMMCQTQKRYWQYATW